jgi:hypothetical protein
MPPQTKKASRAGSRKKAARSNRPTAKAGTKTRKSAPAPRRKAPGASVVAKRDAPVRDSGADMEGEAPTREGQVRRNPQPAAASRQVAEADHMHRDPRWTQPKMDAKWMRAKRDPRKEGGLSKERQVRRMQPVTNWYRQAPKPKGS